MVILSHINNNTFASIRTLSHAKLSYQSLIYNVQWPCDFMPQSFQYILAIHICIWSQKNFSINWYSIYPSLLFVIFGKWNLKEKLKNVIMVFAQILDLKNFWKNICCNLTILFTKDIILNFNQKNFMYKICTISMWYVTSWKIIMEKFGNTITPKYIS